MERFEAEYEVVTPLAMGGANQTPEFRLASFVEVLRWWWRFLALGRYDSDKHRATFWEAVLFGWHVAPFGRKRSLFRQLPCKDAASTSEFPPPWQAADFEKRDSGRRRDDGQAIPELPWIDHWSGINYLSAQAFGLDRGQIQRAPVKCRRFAVEVRLLAASPGDLRSETLGRAYRRFMLRDGGESDAAYAARLTMTFEQEWRSAIDILWDSLAVLGLLGGLGARSRRGFGSLSIVRLDHLGAHDGQARSFERPGTLDQYKERLGTALGKDRRARTRLPPYTAYGMASQIEIVGAANNPRILLNDLGFAFQCYRTWGFNVGGSHRHEYKVGSSRGSRAPAGSAKGTKYAFTGDHIWYLEFKNGTEASLKVPNTSEWGEVPRRIAFGLPHNYGKRREGLSENLTVEPAESGRRASPLLLHIHKLGTSSFIAVVAVFPAVFLPGDMRLNLNMKGRIKDEQTIALDGLTNLKSYNDVASFIDYLTDKGRFLAYLDAHQVQVDAKFSRLGTIGA